MLGQLLESSPRRVRSHYSTVMSIVGHVMVMSGAVAVARPVSDVVEPEPVVTWHPPAPPPPPPCTDCGSRRKGGNSGQAEIPSLPVPAETPGEISIPVSEPVERVGGDIVISSEEWQRGTDAEGEETVESVGARAVVDREVVPSPTNPVPRYPDALRDARIEGRVLVRFVVDTTGRVSMESVVIHAADHPAFGEAVIESLRHSRFRPAEYRGRKVAQLVARPFVFVLRQ